MSQAYDDGQGQQPYDPHYQHNPFIPPYQTPSYEAEPSRHYERSHTNAPQYMNDTTVADLPEYSTQNHYSQNQAYYDEQHVEQYEPQQAYEEQQEVEGDREPSECPTPPVVEQPNPFPEGKKEFDELMSEGGRGCGGTVAGQYFDACSKTPRRRVESNMLSQPREQGNTDDGTVAETDGAAAEGDGEDTDYRPPKPKTVQAMIWSAAALLALGIVLIVAFGAYMNVELMWGMVLLGSLLVVIGGVGVAACYTLGLGVAHAVSGALLHCAGITVSLVFRSHARVLCSPLLPRFASLCGWCLQYRWGLLSYPFISLVVGVANLVFLAKTPCVAPLQKSPIIVGDPISCASRLAMLWITAGVCVLIPLCMFCFGCIYSSGAHVKSLQEHRDAKRDGIADKLLL